MQLHCGFKLLKGDAANNAPLTVVIVYERKNTTLDLMEVGRISFLLKATVKKSLIVKRLSGDHDAQQENGTHLTLSGVGTHGGEFHTLEHDTRDASGRAINPTLVVKKGEAATLKLVFTMPALWFAARQTSTFAAVVRYHQGGRDLFGLVKPSTGRPTVRAEMYLLKACSTLVT